MKILIVIILSLLSFLTGTFIGKQVSDADHRRMALERDYKAELYKSRVPNSETKVIKPAFVPFKVGSCLAELNEDAGKPAEAWESRKAAQSKYSTLYLIREVGKNNYLVQFWQTMPWNDEGLDLTEPFSAVKVDQKWVMVDCKVAYSEMKANHD